MLSVLKMRSVGLLRKLRDLGCDYRIFPIYIAMAIRINIFFTFTFHLRINGSRSATCNANYGAPTAPANTNGCVLALKILSQRFYPADSLCVLRFK